jgi:hypothetical protein
MKRRQLLQAGLDTAIFRAAAGGELAAIPVPLCCGHEGGPGRARRAREFEEGQWTEGGQKPRLFFLPGPPPTGRAGRPSASLRPATPRGARIGASRRCRGRSTEPGDGTGCR